MGNTGKKPDQYKSRTEQIMKNAESPDEVAKEVIQAAKKFNAAMEATNKVTGEEIVKSISEKEPHAMQARPTVDWQAAMSDFFINQGGQSKGSLPPDCGTIMARAYQYYDDVEGSPKLKPYTVPKGETPGMVAARVPRLGDIAYCRGR